jgi:hypothetical protein
MKYFQPGSVQHRLIRGPWLVFSLLVFSFSSTEKENVKTRVAQSSFGPQI